ncbi:MAG: cache domain-containing protein [Candidatus Eisenbacteria bacterium]|nr:cache domain-containing protein [Candidatus Eisenbacteria bacterium]
MLNRFPLSTRIVLLGLTIVGTMFSIAFWMYPTLNGAFMDAKKSKTRDLVDSALNLVEHYAEEAKAGRLTEVEAQEMAASSLGHMQYGEGNYFWINDLDARMVMHPLKPELNGKDLSGFEDPKGKRIFSEFARICREENAGFVDYMWEKPGKNNPVPKLSYVEQYEPWGWVIGTGIYVDDVRADLFRIFGVVGLLCLGIGAVAFVISFLMARSIANPIDSTIRDLETIATEMSSASGQVSATSGSLAQGATQQAASIQETTAWLEEMAVQIDQNADAAQNADGLMKETLGVVGTANGSMLELQKSMVHMEKTSEEIQKIIKAIDDIAFQTNLLALNAAVEAARAGDAGAGFAVVADEVRKLAMRSTEAAQDTSNLIEETVSQIRSGVRLAERSRSDFENASTSASHVGTLIGQITDASRDQAHGVKRVTSALSGIDHVVQQNAAGAEESASAAEEMNAQAKEMRKHVGHLRGIIAGRDAASRMAS